MKLIPLSTERADHRTRDANEGAGNERADEEVVAEWPEEEVERVHSWPSWAP